MTMTDFQIKKKLEHGVFFQMQGDIQKAASLYSEVLVQEPNNPEALHYLGLLAYENKQGHQALALLKHSIVQRPDSYKYCMNYAQILREYFMFDEAIRVFLSLLENHHEDINLHYQLALTYQLAHKDSKAIEQYERVLDLYPEHTLSINNLATIYYQNWYLEDAIQVYQRALQLQPDVKELYNNLGLVLKDYGKYDKSILAFKEAIKLFKTYSEPYFNTGQVYQILNQSQMAIFYYQQAIDLNVKESKYWIALGQALETCGEFEIAEQYYEKGLKLNDSLENNFRLAVQLPLIYKDLQHVKQTRNLLKSKLLDLNDSKQSKCNVINFLQNGAHILYQGGKELPQLRESIANHIRPFLSEFPTIEHKFFQLSYLRIGVFATSASLLNLALPLINLLSQKGFYCQIIAPPQVVSKEQMKQLKTLVKGAHILPLDFEVARESIIKLELDVLIFSEIGFDSLSYFLAFNRMAPIQCALPIYPLTSGLKTIDYYFSSELSESRESEQNYLETLCQFKGLPHYQKKPVFPEELKTPFDFGLSNEPLFICYCDLLNIHPEFDKLIVQLFNQLPEAQIVFLNSNPDTMHIKLTNRWQPILAEYSGRITFISTDKLSLKQQLNLFYLADALLNPFPVSAGYDELLKAFSTGTPIITKAISESPGRMAMACYRKMGILDCIVNSSKEYVSLAIRISKNKLYANKIREKILQKNHVLYSNLEWFNQLVEFLQELGTSSDIS